MPANGRSPRENRGAASAGRRVIRKPAPGPQGAPVATLGPVGTNTWYEVDLSSLIRADGVYSLRITTPSTDGAKWTSRNGDPGFTPQLVVTLLP